MLFRSPVSPPCWQRLNRLAMSPIPGTEQIPPWGAGCRAAVVTAVTGRLAALRSADTGAAADAEAAGAAVAAGCPACGMPGATASTASTSIVRCGEWRNPRILRISGGSWRGGVGVRGDSRRVEGTRLVAEPLVAR